MKKLIYLLITVFTLASCATVKKDGMVQTVRYKGKTVHHKHHSHKSNQRYAKHATFKREKISLSKREVTENAFSVSLMQKTQPVEVNQIPIVKSMQTKETTVLTNGTSAKTEKSMVSEPVSKVPVEVANVNSKSETVKSKRQVQKEKAQKPKSKKSGEKSQLVALLLCLFLGELGIHRFYLGYTGIGIIQLLTLGGFGVWALIDLIMIITGDLKPKNGDYDKTFN